MSANISSRSQCNSCVFLGTKTKLCKYAASYGRLRTTWANIWFPQKYKRNYANMLFLWEGGKHANITFSVETKTDEQTLNLLWKQWIPKQIFCLLQKPKGPQKTWTNIQFTLKTKTTQATVCFSSQAKGNMTKYWILRSLKKTDEIFDFLWTHKII